MPKGSVLIVGGASETGAVFSNSIPKLGYSVETAKSCSDALEKLKTERFVLAIVRMKSPETNAFGFLDEVSGTVPVIIAATNAGVADAIEAMHRGASDFLVMPCAGEAVETAVKRALNGSGRPDLIPEKGARRSAGSRAKGKKIVTGSSKMRGLLDLAARIAPSGATVLIQGPSGSGKELLAAHIHHLSGRSGNSVAINCAALPETLAESELFGYEKGAFTGAAFKKIGKFELADKGTLLLDEISEMPLPLQAKLLRAIQEREIDRIGGSKPVPVDARIIAITNTDLKKAVEEGKFREDLFYRLNVVPMTIPPLNGRKEDVPLLAEHFLKKYASAYKREMAEISNEALAVLIGNDWPGNVRELENAIERATLIGDGKTLLPEHLLLEGVASPGENAPETMNVGTGMTVREMEEKLIMSTLKQVDNNRTYAAQMLGISIRTLRNKLKEYKERDQES